MVYPRYTRSAEQWTLRSECEKTGPGLAATAGELIEVNCVISDLHLPVARSIRTRSVAGSRAIVSNDVQRVARGLARLSAVHTDIGQGWRRHHKLIPASVTEQCQFRVGICSRNHNLVSTVGSMDG